MLSPGFEFNITLLAYSCTSSVTYLTVIINNNNLYLIAEIRELALLFIKRIQLSKCIIYDSVVDVAELIRFV